MRGTSPGHWPCGSEHTTSEEHQRDDEQDPHHRRGRPDRRATQVGAGEVGLDKRREVEVGVGEPGVGEVGLIEIRMRAASMKALRTD
jgi:hypothetical protein